MKQLAPLLKGKGASPDVAGKPVPADKGVAQTGKGAARRADLCKESDFSGFYDGTLRVAPVLTFRSRGDTEIAVHRLAPGVTAYVEKLSLRQRPVLKRELVSGQDPAKVVQSLMRPGRKVPDAVKRLSLEHATALKQSGQPKEPPREDDVEDERQARADIANLATSMAATIRQRKCLDVDWNSVENVRKWKKMKAALDGIAADPFKMPARPTPQDLQKHAVPQTEKPAPLSKPEIAESVAYCSTPCQWHEWWDQNYGKNYQHNWGCVDFSEPTLKKRCDLNSFDGSFLKDQKPGVSTWMTNVRGWRLGGDFVFFKANYVHILSVPGDLMRLTFSIAGVNSTKVINFAFSDEPCVFFSLGYTIND